MECRSNCGACCIAPSIVKPFLGMPEGKPAGVRCVHLLDDYRCAIFESPERPQVCSDFKPDEEFCKADRESALIFMLSLEDDFKTTAR